MESVVLGLTYKACLVSLYHIIAVVGRTSGDTVNMWMVFWRFRAAHLKLKTEKCQLFQKEVWYLEHASPGRVTTDAEKLKTVQRWSPPPKRNDLGNFLDCVPATGC
jgi:hypothetical protein